MKAVIVFSIALAAALYAQASHASDLADTYNNKEFSISMKAQRKAAILHLKRDFREGRIAERTDETISKIIDRGTYELQSHGFDRDAQLIRFEYEARFKGFLTRLTLASRDGYNIGDHKPLSAWLTRVYDKLEKALGYELCNALHLTDIKTINYTIPVVFNPCDTEWDKAEYRKHFAGDGRYHGLMPVVTYWVVDLTCVVGSHGGGIFFICGLLATGAELLVEKYVAPKVSDFVYEKACHQ